MVDSEVLMALLKKKGFSFTEDLKIARVFIINTCAFIESAKQESIDAILEAASFKEKGINSEKLLIVAGCLPQRYSQELKKEIPEIDGIFGSADFVKIPDFISGSKALRLRSGLRESIFVSKTPSFLYDHKFNRTFITPPHYAYIKLQEGCMNNCSYCVIPKLRGPYRSRDFDSIIKEAELLKKTRNIKEINLIGQDTTLYGIDRYGKVRLAGLLKKLAKIMKDGWIRLLYTHPAHYSDELIDIISGENSICKYLDLPIQHIENRILKDMNRDTTKEQIICLIRKLRKKIPDLAIRTTVMVGFPGETEKEFEKLLTFIEDIKFERLGAFMYSREEGTKAYTFSRQLPEVIKEERYNRILKIQQDISKEKNTSYLGKIFKVLIDEETKKGHTEFLGRTQMDAPEVDGTCYVKSDRHLRLGSFRHVKIVDTLEYDLVGEIV